MGIEQTDVRDVCDRGEQDRLKHYLIDLQVKCSVYRFLFN